MHPGLGTSDPQSSIQENIMVTHALSVKRRISNAHRNYDMSVNPTPSPLDGQFFQPLLTKDLSKKIYWLCLKAIKS